MEAGGCPVYRGRVGGQDHVRRPPVCWRVCLGGK